MDYETRNTIRDMSGSVYRRRKVALLTDIEDTMPEVDAIPAARKAMVVRLSAASNELLHAVLNAVGDPYNDATDRVCESTEAVTAELRAVGVPDAAIGDAVECLSESCHAMIRDLESWVGVAIGGGGAQ
jgi:hypothetical protein